ncbi:hypothetical protein AB0D94_31195 [Streptomyces sp. NPDC048255]|uniref:hypothetical protein n=1 Tax=Streptomyces sp. NPDC048255 TaxID=3154713 RepID=UPI0033E1030C
MLKNGKRRSRGEAMGGENGFQGGALSFTESALSVDRSQHGGARRRGLHRRGQGGGVGVLEILREPNAAGARYVPDKVPTLFRADPAPGLRRRGRGQGRCYREGMLREADICLVSYHHQLSATARFGSGILSFSDGQPVPGEGQADHPAAPLHP